MECLSNVLRFENSKDKNKVNKFLKKIDESDKKKKEKSKKTEPKTKLAKDWTDEDTSLLIDQFESKPCLWDVYHISC